MKTTKRIWLRWGAVFGAFLFTASLLAQPSGSPTPSDDSKPGTNEQMQAEDNDTGSNAVSGMEDQPGGRAGNSRQGLNREAMVIIGHDARLKAGETAQTVVVIGGSAKIAGKVHEAVVAIGGNVELEKGAEVGQAAVAVLGDIRAAAGATIDGDAVAVGGKLDVAEGATVRGQVQEVDLMGLGFPRMNWLKQWVVHCLFLLRPLSFQVGWAWAVAGAFFLFYLLVAAVFQKPVRACLDELTYRPATTFVMGLMTALLSPLAILILTVTGIGVFVVPFVIAALFLGGVVGKIALAEGIGSRIGGRAPLFQNPIPAFVLGTIVILALYLVPVLGLVTMAVLCFWSLGLAVTAAVGGLRSEIPGRSAAPPPPPAPEPAMAAAGWGGTEATHEGFSGSTPSWTPESRPETGGSPPPAGPSSFSASDPGSTGAQEPGTGSSTPPPPPSGSSAYPIEPPPIPEAMEFPRASFWTRMGAGFLDFVLIGILSSPLHRMHWTFIVALAYFAGMWAWRGTTIGGIVLALKVARQDGEPLTFPVALVRALAAAFSIIVLFLGFLWIAWDKEKQGWHDRIAGTVVVRLPKGTPLICL